MRSVRTLYTSMMVLLTKSTDRELARMVSYLKEENRILRARLPERINTTPTERERLLRFGRNLGKAIHSVVKSCRRRRSCAGCVKSARPSRGDAAVLRQLSRCEP